MIDTLNLSLGVYESGGLDFLSCVPPLLEHRNMGQSEDWGEFCTGYLGTLKISVNRMRVKIAEGSFCKWVLGDNIQTLKRKNIQEGVEKLSDLLHLPMDRALVSRLDIAQNIVTKHPVPIYLNHLGQLKYHKRLPQKDGLYYTGINTQWVGYDKIKQLRREGEIIPELYRGRNVLRCELRVLHRIPDTLKQKEVTASMLYDEAFYIQLIEMWRQFYQSIEKVNETILNFEQMKTKSELYQMGVLNLIEQRGGLNSFIDEVTEGYKIGRLTAKQAHDLKEVAKRACRNFKSGMVVKSEAIAELDEKVEMATKFYR